MGRLIIGIVAGLVAAFATIWAIEMIGHQIYPVPSDLAMDDFEAIGAYIETMPAPALALVALAWFAGALVGGFVAASIGRRRWAAWLIAALVAAAAVVNIVMIPHPVLLQLAAIVAPAVGGLIAGHLAGGRAEAPAA